MSISKHTVQLRRVTTMVIAGFLLAGVAAPAYGDQYDDQINAIQQQISQQKSQIGNLQAQAATLSAQLDAINAQVAAITSQLELTQTQLAQVNDHIAQLNAQMVSQKAFLSENIKTMYLQSSTTPLEILMSSNNISDYFNKQEYLDKVKDKIQSALATIEATKKELADQLQKLTDLGAQQKTQQEALQTQQANAANLLAQTQGQEAAYQSLVAQNNQKLQAVVAARAEAIRRSGIKFTSAGCGGYPSMWCNVAQDSTVDNWGYYNRECVSYVAWKRYALGQSPQPSYWGNAADWYRYVNHYNPRAGDIVVWRAYANQYIGWAGHVAYVESVSGNTVTLSQYNFDVGSGPGKYSLMTLSMDDSIMQGAGFIY